MALTKLNASKFLLLAGLILGVMLPVRGFAEVFLTQENQLERLRTGPELNQARLRLIREADRFVYIKTFIINRDSTESEVYRALCERARQGLDVRILVDDLGRRQGGNPMRMRGELHSIQGLRSCGIRFETFAPPVWGPLAFILYNQHDKMLLSEKAAIIGGTNFSRDYSRHGQLSPHWYDFDLGIRGPAVCSLLTLFTQSWRQVEQKSIDLIHRVLRPTLEYFVRRRFSSATLHAGCVATPVEGGDSLILLYGNPYFSSERPFMAYFETAMRSLQNNPTEHDRTIRLYAPYFVPSSEFRARLVEAARRGVRVQIITNSESSIDPEASPAYAAMLMRVPELIQAGVEIYLWSPSEVSGALPRNNVFHRKGGCFGTQACFIGSHNLDIRGDEYSSELLAVFADRSLIDAQIRDFEDDLSHSFRINEAERARLLEKVRFRDRAAAIAAGWAM